MLDLFVRVPPNVTAPVTYTPMEVDAINQVADGRARGKRVTFRLQQTSFLMAGGVSVEDESKRTETVRPQFGECCDSQSECDSMSSVTSDGNDIELDGETDGEDMEGITLRAASHRAQKSQVPHKSDRLGCRVPLALDVDAWPMGDGQ